MGLRMSPSSDLREVLFPAVLAPLVARTAEGELQVGHSRAVLDGGAGRVLSAVSRDYRSVTHERWAD